MMKKLLIILGIFIIIGGITTIFNTNKDHRETILIPSNSLEKIQISYSNASGKTFEDVFHMEVTEDSILIKEKQRSSFLFWGVTLDSELEILGNENKINFLETDLVSTSLSIKNLEGEKFILSSMSGDIELEDVQTKTINGSTFSSDIDLSNVTATTMKLETTSGGMDLSTVTTTNTIQLETTSGDVDLSTVTTNTIQLETTSGDVDLSTITTDTIQLETTSGDVDLSTITTDTIQLITKSGDVNLSEVYGELQFTSVSGDVELNNLKLTHAITGKTTSGDVLLSFAEKINDVNFQSKTDSGAISFFHEPTPRVLLGDGSINILLETVSGDITIK